MKYRQLSESELETYNVGYRVGTRELVIADIEWESESERLIYRKGYLAGCKDRLRHNVSAQCQQCQQCQHQENVNNVCNVNSVTVTDTVTVNNIPGNNNINNNNTTRACKNPSQDEVLEYARQQNEFAGAGGFAVTPEIAQDFYDYYSGIGWVLPNDFHTPIVDWKPFLRKWVRNPRYKNNTVVPEEEDSRFKYEFHSVFENKKGGTK